MTDTAIDIGKATSLLWEMAEDPRNHREACMLRKIAGTLERLDRENRELRGRGIKLEVAA